MTPDYHLTDMLPHSRLHIVTETVSAITATSAMAAPLWFPALKDASEVVAVLLPFGGAIVIILQIVVYVRRLRRGNRNHQP